MPPRSDDPPRPSWFDKHSQTKGEIHQPMARAGTGVSPKRRPSSPVATLPIGPFKFCGKASMAERFVPHPVCEFFKVANQDVVQLPISQMGLDPEPILFQIIVMNLFPCITHFVLRCWFGWSPCLARHDTIWGENFLPLSVTNNLG
jgi:hypothetical protein